MYAIVAGCGRVGSQLALMLSADGHDVVIIDHDESSFRKRLGPVFNGVQITGFAFDLHTLREAGADKADAFAAVTEFDNTNLVAAEVATNMFEIPRVYSRLYNPDKEITNRKLGVNYILGTRLVAQKFYERLTQPGIAVQASLGGGAQVIEFPAGAQVEGQRAGEIATPGQVKVVGVRRGDEVVIPDELTPLHEGDGLIVMCFRDGVAGLLDKWRA